MRDWLLAADWREMVLAWPLRLTPHSKYLFCVEIFYIQILQGNWHRIHRERERESSLW